MPDTARFYTVERLSETRRVTPEGFLVCVDTPVARTGMQLYADGEVPVQAGGDGLVRVDRSPEEVFRPETIASLAGKPVVVDHPEQDGEIVDVRPDNWQQFTVGSVLNPHRGEGVLDDAIVADMVIYDPRAIDEINSGRRREVSVGYDAEYVETGPGRAEQKNILANHLAIVEQGRCGPMCSVRDNATRDAAPRSSNARHDSRGGRRMARIGDLLARAFRARDAEELKDIEKEWQEGEGKTGDEGTGEPATTPEGESLHVHIHSEGGSAGAGGSAESARPAADARRGDARRGDNGMGMSRFGDDDIAAMQQVCQQLQQEHQQILQKLAAIEQAIGMGGGGEAEGGDSPMMSYGGDARDNGPEERFTPEANEDIPAGVAGAEAPPGADQEGGGSTGDRRRRAAQPRVRARDSAHLEEQWQDLVAQAEIIVPGVRVPTFDRARAAAQTLDAMCRFRRGVLTQAHGDPELRETVDSLVGGAYNPRGAMTCDAVAAAFRALSVMQRDRNNAIVSRGTGAGNGGFRVNDGYAEAQGIAAVNRKMRERAAEVWGTGLGS